MYSESLIKRMKLFKEISEIRSKAAKKRWKNPNGMQNECKSNANADQKQSNKIKLNKTKLDYTKKEDINNTPDGDNALTGNLPDGYSVHENSGEIYTVVDGVMYNIYGEELNPQGFKKIDFNLSKHNL